MDHVTADIAGAAGDQDRHAVGSLESSANWRPLMKSQGSHLFMPR